MKRSFLDVPLKDVRSVYRQVCSDRDSPKEINTMSFLEEREITVKDKSIRRNNMEFCAFDVT